MPNHKAAIDKALDPLLAELHDILPAHEWTQGELKRIGKAIKRAAVEEAHQAAASPFQASPFYAGPKPLTAKAYDDHNLMTKVVMVSFQFGAHVVEHQQALSHKWLYAGPSDPTHYLAKSLAGTLAGKIEAELAQVIYGALMGPKPSPMDYKTIHIPPDLCGDPWTMGSPDIAKAKNGG